MTQWETTLRNLPHKAPFTIQMDADSTNEVWVDIPTRLKKNEAWHVVGLDYTFENIDPTVPAIQGKFLDQALALQVQRGVDSEILLPAFDPLTLLHHSKETFVGGTDGLFVMDDMPKHVAVDEVTRHEFLRVLFRTSEDVTAISAPTVQLTGQLRYHLISAPDDGRTKIGIDIDEI